MTCVCVHLAYIPLRPSAYCYVGLSRHCVGQRKLGVAGTSHYATLRNSTQGPVWNPLNQICYFKVDMGGNCRGSCNPCALLCCLGSCTYDPQRLPPPPPPPSCLPGPLVVATRRANGLILLNNLCFPRWRPDRGISHDFLTQKCDSIKWRTECMHSPISMCTWKSSQGAR